MPTPPPDRATPHPRTGAGGNGAVVFAAAAADLDAAAALLRWRLFSLVVAATVGVTGAADTVGAGAVEGTGVSVTTGAGTRARVGTGAATTGAGALGFSEGRAGVTCFTTVASVPGAALAAGLADGDAVTLTRTIARYATHDAAAR